MNLTMIGFVVIVALGWLAGFEGYALKKSYETNGALKISVLELKQRIKEINDAQRELDKVHNTNRALPDDKLFDGLLPTPDR